MSDKRRIYILLFLIFTFLFAFASPADSAHQLSITITPIRPASYQGTDAEFQADPTYVQGEQASFNITFTHEVRLPWRIRFRIPAYISSKFIKATFPNSKTRVALNHFFWGYYTYTSPELTEIGNNNHTLTVAVYYRWRFRLWGTVIEIPILRAFAERSISVIPQPLSIEITSPSDGVVLNTNLLTVAGTVSDNSAEVTVNGVSAIVSDNQFNAEIPVPEGENTITARAENEVGATASDSVTVTIDTIPPGIVITSPPNGSTVTETPITVTGTTNDAEAAITVNGLPVVNDGGGFRREGIALTPGENTITITAVDAAGNSNSATIRIIYNSDPPPEEIPESGFITGNVFHSRTLAPLPTASIRVNTVEGQVLTDNEGRYRFPINEFPEENQRNIEIEISKPGFTTSYRKVEITSTRHTYVDAAYLTPVDPEVTVIRPDPAEEQRHTSADGTVELIFPPGSVPYEIEVTATNFQHSQELPGALPETSFFTYCVDLQPGVEFNEPVTLRIANELGFVPGTLIPIGIYNEETLRWEDTGLMSIVTPDGNWLEAQIEHFTPYDCNFPPSPQEPPPEGINEQTTSVQNPDKEAVVPRCRISIKTGNFSIDHILPSNRVLGIPQSLTLTYSGNTANPNILIDTEVNNDPLIVTPPDKIKWELSVEGLYQEKYFEGASDEIRFRYLYDCHNSDRELFPTGRYSYSIDISNVYTNETYWTADSFGGPPGGIPEFHYESRFCLVQKERVIL